MRICLLDEDDFYFYGDLCNGKVMTNTQNEFQVSEFILVKFVCLHSHFSEGIDYSTKHDYGKNEQIFFNSF